MSSINDTDVVKGFRQIQDILPAHWTEGKVEANGIRHHYYRTGGSNPPLVLLHGFLEGALTWMRAARALEADYDVIMVDARGHGRSSRIDTRYSPDLLTKDIAGIIRALGLDRVRLLGHSQGGDIAIRLATTHSPPVHTLIVEGAADRNDTHPDTFDSPGYQAWLSNYVSWLEDLKTQTHTERMLSALSQLAPGARLPSEEDFVAWIENCVRLDINMVKLGATLWTQLGATFEETQQALQRVICPVLVMMSAFFPSPGDLHQIRDEYSDQPNLKTVRFENIGHLIHRDGFDQFIRIVEEFFKEH